MNRLDSCPAWCSQDHEPDDVDPIHSTDRVRVTTGRVKRDRLWELLPDISVSVVLFELEGVNRPARVAVIPSSSISNGAWAESRLARGLAEVIERLANATPAQHRELADAIRQAAAVIAEGGDS